MNKTNWTIYGYKRESTDVIWMGKAQYVSDVQDRVRDAIGAGAEIVVVLKDNDDGN